MRKQRNPIHSEEGFVLVTALMFMLVLTIIGISTTTNTSIELQIAGNDKVYKKTFYEAEAGAILGTEILEQNLSCATGFAKTGTGLNSAGATVNVADLLEVGPPIIAPAPARIRAFEKGGEYVLWNNSYPAAAGVGTETNADIVFPIANIPSNQEVTYLYIGGVTQMQAGGSLQMAAGYEGKGKAAAQGGVSKLFNIYSQFNGLVNSEAIILFGWRHLVGSEGDCYFD